MNLNMTSTRNPFFYVDMINDRYHLLNQQLWISLGTLGFSMTKCNCPRFSRSLEFRFLNMMTAGLPLMELCTLLEFQTSQFSNVSGSCPQDSRSAESRYADGLSPFENFPEGLDCFHRSSYDGWFRSNLETSGMRSQKHSPV
jgi:hypothetical protein